jgi:Family of unknown function (DUF6600)
MRLKRVLSMGVLAAALYGFAAPPAAHADVAVSVSFFHQQLTPYGRWVVAGSYGNCWVPGGVAASWSPYVAGQGLYTDYGWTWASNDPWGDIPYHYGTWAWVPPYGWVWVPGTVWAPAWVTWAYTDDFIGWAPVPPSFAFSVGGYVGGPVVVAQTRYVFVPSQQFVGVPVQSVRVAPQQNSVIFRRATKVTSFPVSNGIVRTAGLPAERVERATGHRIERVSIERARTQPTSVEHAGFQKAKTIPVVAPKRERAQAITAERSVKAEKPAKPETSAKTQPRTERETKAQAPPPREAKAQPQAHPQREAQPPERSAEVQHKSAEQKSAERKQAQAKPKPTSKESEHRQAQRSQPPPEKVQEAPPPRPNTEARAKPVQEKPVQEAHRAEPKNNPRPAQKPKPQPKPEKPDKDKPSQD